MSQAEFTIKGDITKISLKPGDVIVCEVNDRYLSEQEIQNVHYSLKRAFPDNIALIINKPAFNAEIKVFSPVEAKEIVSKAEVKDVE